MHRLPAGELRRVAALLGYPVVPINRMVSWVTKWVGSGKPL